MTKEEDYLFMKVFWVIHKKETKELVKLPTVIFQ
jgi:hypothetical protein